MPKFAPLILLIPGLLLTACDRGANDALPAGQTIARVDGQDVTIHELNAELKGVSLPSGAARKTIEQQALQKIVDRRILAGLARDRKLDKSPDFVLLKQRAEEAVLVDLLQQTMVNKAKRPTVQDAQLFIQQNPSLFADRRIAALDQFVFPMPVNPNKLQELAPMKTMAEVEKWLLDNGIQYRRQPGRLDTLQIDPAATRRILSLPPGEVFIVPANGVASANVITKIQAEPVPAAEATRLAMTILQNRAVMATANRELEAEVNKRRQSVTYQTGFAPPKPPSAPRSAAKDVAPARL
jgi:EpsD family peptidyl-prolyl cis-trans isomerase